MSHTAYTPYNLKVNCLMSIIHLLELFIVFNSLQRLITGFLWLFGCVIQEVDMESSSSKQDNFLSQNTLL